jgi:hypothetical protein
MAGGNSCSWRFDGTGGAVSLGLTGAMINPATGTMHAQAGSASHFFLQDVGPTVIGSAPLLSNPDSRWNTAWGVVTSVVKMSSSGSTGTPVIDTGISVTFTPVANRRYAVMFEGLAVVSAAGNVCNLNVTDAANVTVQGGGTSPGVPNTGQSLIVTAIVEPVNTTPLTYKARHFTSGSGTCYFYADGNAPMRMIVTDIGPTSAYIPAPDPTPAWINVSFQNGWVNYGSVYQTVQYRKVGDMVQIRGLAKSGTIGQVIFTLPGGYAPLASLQFAVDNAAKYGMVEVTSTGGVVLNASVVGANNIVVNFNPIQFSVTP